MGPAQEPAAEKAPSPEERRQGRIEEAKATLAPDKATAKQAAPVYDSRGNVRPRGTKGARPMTYEERVKIAKRLTAKDA